jgi:hypothetical protein
MPRARKSSQESTPGAVLSAAIAVFGACYHFPKGNFSGFS